MELHQKMGNEPQETSLKMRSKTTFTGHGECNNQRRKRKYRRKEVNTHQTKPAWALFDYNLSTTRKREMTSIILSQTVKCHWSHLTLRAAVDRRQNPNDSFISSFLSFSWTLADRRFWNHITWCDIWQVKNDVS
jgi:hypothetical protein